MLTVFKPTLIESKTLFCLTQILKEISLKFGVLHFWHVEFLAYCTAGVRIIGVQSNSGVNLKSYERRKYLRPKYDTPKL